MRTACFQKTAMRFIGFYPHIIGRDGIRPILSWKEMCFCNFLRNNQLRSAGPTGGRMSPLSDHKLANFFGGGKHILVYRKWRAGHERRSAFADAIEMRTDTQKMAPLETARPA